MKAERLTALARKLADDAVSVEPVWTIPALLFPVPSLNFENYGAPFQGNSCYGYPQLFQFVVEAGIFRVAKSPDFSYGVNRYQGALEQVTAKVEARNSVGDEAERKKRFQGSQLPEAAS